MVYKIYPALLFVTCSLVLVAWFLVVRALNVSSWVLLVVPVPATVTGYLASAIVVSRFPRIRYVNASEVDGLGYVHQPLGPMLLVCLIGFAAAILQIVR